MIIKVNDIKYNFIVKNKNEKYENSTEWNYNEIYNYRVWHTPIRRIHTNYGGRNMQSSKVKALLYSLTYDKRFSFGKWKLFRWPPSAAIAAIQTTNGKIGKNGWNKKKRNGESAIDKHLPLYLRSLPWLYDKQI